MGMLRDLWHAIQQQSAPSPRRPFRGQEAVVRVSYIGIEEPLPDLERTTASGYAIRWTLPGEPTPGRRVIVKGLDGPTGGVVIGMGRGNWDGPLEPISRGLSDAEQRRVNVAEEAFFAAARRAVGLKADGRRKVREGWPEIAPAKGKASPTEAGTHGRAWWRIYKMAERYARPDEEVKAYAATAHRWFAIRDRNWRAPGRGASIPHPTLALPFDSSSDR